MIAAAEAAAGIYGVWLLARRQKRGLDFLDDSVHGFWQSFWAAPIVLPGMLLLRVLDGSLALDGGTLRPLAVQLIAYVIQWTAFPLVVSGIVESMGRGHRYLRYVVAYNWSAVVQMAVFLPVAITAHLFPAREIVLITMAVTVLLLAYQAYIAHTALETPLLPSVALVLLDMLIGGLIDKVTERLAAG